MRIGLAVHSRDSLAGRLVGVLRDLGFGFLNYACADNKLADQQSVPTSKRCHLRRDKLPAANYANYSK